MKTQNFVKSMMAVKEKNELDLSADEDLSIALMNLVSLEEHAFFSYVKTHEKNFLEVLETCRELRKTLLAKLIKKDRSERWCMSKHLLAASMRLYEVGNRALHEGKKNEARARYEQAAELYALFWKLNSAASERTISYKTREKKSIFSSIKKLLECCKE